MWIFSHLQEKTVQELNLAVQELRVNWAKSWLEGGINLNFKCCCVGTKSHSHCLYWGRYASPRSVSQQHWKNALMEYWLLGLPATSLPLALAHLTSPPRSRVATDWSCGWSSCTVAPAVGPLPSLHHRCPPRSPPPQHNMQRSWGLLWTLALPLVVYLKEKKTLL